MSEGPEVGARPNGGVQRRTLECGYTVHSMRLERWAGTRSCRTLKATLRNWLYSKSNEEQLKSYCMWSRGSMQVVRWIF